MAAALIPPEGQPGSANKYDMLCVRMTFGYSGADVLAIAQTTYAIASVKLGTLVPKVLTRVITAWTASVTITMGDGNSAAGFFSTANIAPQTAVATGVMKDSEGMAGAYATGIKYPADDTIDIVVAGATPVAGLSEAFFVFTLAGL